MSDVELGNDKRSEKTAGRMETTRAGVCISLPLSTQVELQEVGVSFFFFFHPTKRHTEGDKRGRDGPGDRRETRGGKVSDSVRQRGKGRVIILCWRRRGKVCVGRIYCMQFH